MTLIDIPSAFSDAFIKFANDVNQWDDDPLDLSVDDDKRSLHLSNSEPGFSPFLQLRSSSGGTVTVEICGSGNKRLADGTLVTTVTVAETVDVRLSDIPEAVRMAIECWHSTL
ncbi:hypothetical protein GCM10020255_025760 [Rhodococcus baikonurensis]